MKDLEGERVDPFVCIIPVVFRDGPQGLNWLHTEFAEEKVRLGHFARNSQEHYDYCIDKMPDVERYIPNPEYRGLNDTTE